MEKSFIKSVCDKYNLGGLKSFSVIPLGLINKKILITSSRGKFVLRLSIRSARQLEFEVALLNHICELKVVRLMPYAPGKYISFYNKTPYLVYKFIKGEIPKKITLQLINQIGKFQGKFHVLGRSFKLQVKRDYYYDFSKPRVREFYKKLYKKTPPQFKKQFRVVRDTLLNIQLPKNIPTGPIHVDIKPENVLVKKGELAGVLDFDNSYFGPYIIDIGKTVMWWCINKGRVNQQNFQEFIKAYTSQRKLTSIEQRLLGQSILHAIASHIYIDYLKYQEGIIPLSYLTMLHREFYPVLLKDINR